jgi:ABC-2 type transport system ATP-binding protein
MAAIDVRDLRKSFAARRGAPVEAVAGITFSVDAGERLAYIGPNGAGKSTSIKMLTGILHPTSGDAAVLGIVPWKRRRELAARIGTLFGQRSQLWYQLTPRQTYSLLARIYRIPGDEERRRIGELGDLLEATQLFDQPVRGLSLGQRMRCELVASMLHAPEVLFLDEPTIGIDPVGARELRATIAALREQGKTILLTTHYMFEADELCDRIAVIRDGQIVAEGSPAVLKHRVSAGHVVEVETFGLPTSGTDAVRRVEGVRSVSVEERGQAQVLLVQVEPGAEVTSGVLARLNGTRVGRVSSREPTLEDAYVELVSGS